jgi:hypothetical protein
MRMLTTLCVSLLLFPPIVWPQEAVLPFSFTVNERTENLPTFISPPSPNLYNNNPNLRVGWGIDSPTGVVVIDGEVWVMFNDGNQYGTHVKVARFRGADVEHTTRQTDGAIDVEKGVSTHFCGGMWYDTSTGILYAPIHCEYDRGISPPAGWTRKKTRLAASSDKGVTWDLRGDILTDYLPGEGDWLKFSGSYFESGPGDFDFYVDNRGGYFYIFTGNSYAPKNGRMNNFLWYNEAARCAISDRMAPGKWHKFRNGTWSEPGLGGKSSRVCMGSYGLYGRVIYSRFLRKYLRIGVRLGVIDRRFTDLGFADGSIYVSACEDLSTQQWTPPGKLLDKPDNDKFGITLTDGNAVDPLECDRSLRVYNYWLYNIPSRALDITLEPGATVAEHLRFGSYAYEPLPESGDPVVSRRTKIVGCAAPENVYTGSGWTIRSDPKFYRMQAMECAVPGNSVQFSFNGDALYWRGIAGKDCGKADLFIDDIPEETIDCYYRQALPFQFAFVKTGLDPRRTHTVRIVVRSDRNPGSSGSVIRHMAFEYSAESYRASAGFSGVRGKNNWYCRQWNGKEYDDLHFVDSAGTASNGAAGGGETGVNFWGSAENCIVGQTYQTPGENAPVRVWMAPHEGTVRIEGDVRSDGDSGTVATAKIMKNFDEVWNSQPLTSGKTALHDHTMKVNMGDALNFIVTGTERTKVFWDPVITYEGNKSE